ncbi:MAG: rhodanese-like domain-containing protein [Candidatus Binatia bacterium]
MPIRQISPQELGRLIADGIILADVRTQAEREIARIEGGRLLDEDFFEELCALDRATPIAFHCHHGMRSQAAAEHFASLGFTTLYNLAGGIDAWSAEIDPKVPRY